MVSVAGGIRGAVSTTAAMVISGTVLVGAGIGVGLQQAGVIGGDTHTVEVALDEVNLYECPDGASAGVVRRGDRVLATGRDASGEWAQIRDPVDLSGRVWVGESYLVPDATLADLEVVACTAESPVTTTTVPFAGLPGTSTPTTRPRGPGTPAVPSAPTTTSGPAADTQGPAIAGVSASPSTIYEADSPGDKCSINGSFATKSTVSASVSDPSGTQSVTMSWQVASTSGSKAMTGSGVYQATLGPFPASTIPQSTTSPITVTITAKDGAGNTSAASTTVTLNDCTFT